MMQLTRRELPRPVFLPSLMVWLLCFIAVSTSLGTAVAAIGRLLLYLLALAAFVWHLRERRQTVHNPPWHTLSAIVLVTCIYMALTILWSRVDLGAAMASWSRHARLLAIPLLCYLLRDTPHARTVLKAFVYAQIFVVVNSWLLVAGIHPPWITGLDASKTYAVFGSYLEQSISQAVLAALLWHQRDSIFGKHGKNAAIAMALVTLVHTFGFLSGRTGHVVALGLMALAFFHQVPRPYKWTTVLVPFVALALVSAGSPHFRERMLQISSDIRQYTHHQNADTSSGERISYWRASLVAIAEKPVQGYGAGSWTHEYQRIESNSPHIAQFNVDNPHQLFLLWAVEGGLVGMALLCAVLAVLWRHSKKLATPDALSLQAVVAALVLSGLFNSMIYGIGMGDFFCVGLGILASMVPGTYTDTDKVTDHG